MQEVKTIPVQTGEEFYLTPLWTAKNTDTGYLLICKSECMNVNSDKNGEITQQVVEDLTHRGVGSTNKSSLFAEPLLVESVFNWELETSLLVDLIEKNNFKSVYDVGCGIGRLSLFLSKKFPNLLIYAVDCSWPLIKILSSKKNDSNGRIETFTADVCDLSFPGNIDFAFSALNTIRYLGSRHRIKKHLRCVAASVRPGGLYAFHCGISPTPEILYHNTWDFTYEGRICEAHWRNISYSHLSNSIVDQVTIKDKLVGNTLLQEYQCQVYLSSSIIKEFIESLDELWKLERILAPGTYETVNFNKALQGNYWFVLKRLEF